MTDQLHRLIRKAVEELQGFSYVVRAMMHLIYKSA